MGIMWGLFEFYSCPEMDKRNLQNRGEEYEIIMKEVSMFVPWPSVATWRLILSNGEKAD